MKAAESSEETLAATKVQSLLRGRSARLEAQRKEGGRSKLLSPLVIKRRIDASGSPRSPSLGGSSSAARQINARVSARHSAETLKNHLISDLNFINDDVDTDQMLGEEEGARTVAERCNRKWKAYQQLVWYWVDQRISGFWAAKYLLLLMFIVVMSLFSASLLAIALQLDNLFVDNPKYDGGNKQEQRSFYRRFGNLWWLGWGMTIDGPYHVEWLAEEHKEWWNKNTPWCFFTVASGVCSFMGILVMSSFLGVMVDLVERARPGASAIMEKNHHIILNWSGEIHFLLEQLGYAMESERGGTVVVLNDRPKVDQLKDLKSVSRSLKRRGINLLVRNGSPRSLDELTRVGVSSAKSIIMLSPSIEDPLGADVECSHVILQISSVVEHTQVPIILELRDEESRLLVEAAARGRCNPVAAHDMASRVMAQSSYTRRLADVYESILGFEGDEFYFVNMAEMPEILGKSFGDILYCVPDAVPIGFSTGGSVTLNPDNSVRFMPGMELIVYAEDDSKIVYKAPQTLAMNRTVTLPVVPATKPGLGDGMEMPSYRGRRTNVGLPGLPALAAGGGAAQALPGSRAKPRGRRTVLSAASLIPAASEEPNDEPNPSDEDTRKAESILICGWCRNMEEIIVTLDASLLYGSTISILCQKSIEDRIKAFSENGFDPTVDLMNIKIRHYIGEASAKPDLLQLSKPSVVEMNHILVIADESHGNDRMRSDAQNLCILFNVKQVTEEERQSVWMLQQSGIDLANLKKRGRNNPTAVNWDSFKTSIMASKVLSRLAPSPEPSRKNVHVVVEILDAKTRAVVQDDPRLSESCDWMTSPNLVAKILSMAAERPETVWILKTLLTHESGNHLFVRSASRYVKHGESVNFWTIMKRAQKEKHIALGYTNGAHGNVVMNPKEKDVKRTWDVLDNIVTIGYDDAHDKRLAALKAIHTTTIVGRASNKFKSFVGKHIFLDKVFASCSSTGAGPLLEGGATATVAEDRIQAAVTTSIDWKAREAEHKLAVAAMRKKVKYLEHECEDALAEVERLREQLGEALHRIPRTLNSAPASTSPLTPGLGEGGRSKKSLLGRTPSNLLDASRDRGDNGHRGVYLDL